MNYNPDIHHRRSIRLRGYDYSRPGAYFVTICAQNRECLFGDVVDGVMVLNDFGRVVKDCWHGLPTHYCHVALDESVIMPNHFHGIIILMPIDPIPVGAGLKPARTESARTDIKRHGLSEIVRGFKTFSARYINEIRNAPGVKLWQRNYWERVVRDEDELNRIREYIRTNPVRWEMDQLYPGQP
ncbi:transposase [Geothermobacter hydrogeniphilus]|uniref:Transposase IS200-like domain-containing protein n=1 Tax=Geothermobacter hydrogeniphilus TaxID=1969733 RepID=A0A1X0Y2D1_9BACT|nr:transposase [Geothermobacter hydrogeniphilus]ORJ59296.1 hypothetical protein B5V00_10400 [Geothermobacter hydrogeniphilus]